MDLIKEWVGTLALLGLLLLIVPVFFMAMITLHFLISERTGMSGLRHGDNLAAEAESGGTNAP